MLYISSFANTLPLCDRFFCRIICACMNVCIYMCVYVNTKTRTYRFCKLLIVLDMFISSAFFLDCNHFDIITSYVLLNIIFDLVLFLIISSVILIFCFIILFTSLIFLFVIIFSHFLHILINLALLFLHKFVFFFLSRKRFIY